MKYTTFTTSKGKAYYPNLRSPNIYEGTDLGYDCKLLLPNDKAMELEMFLRKELAKAAESPEFAGKNLDASDAFIGKGETEEGETYFKFKTKSTYKNKAGGIINRVIPIFDAHGKPFPADKDVGHGSIVRINYAILPFWKSRKIKGLSLILNAVQVIDLVERGGGNGFNSFGFEDEENGYSVESTDEDMPFVDNTDAVEDGADF